MAVNFTFNAAGWDRFERDNLVTWMQVLISEVEAGAAVGAPVGKGPTAGELASSGSSSVSRRGGKVSGEVVFGARHAEMVHNGTPPHDIGGDGQILANRLEGFGPVRGPVRHPGTRPNPFLRNALNAALLRRGMRPTSG